MPLRCSPAQRSQCSGSLGLAMVKPIMYTWLQLNMLMRPMVTLVGSPDREVSMMGAWGEPQRSSQYSGICGRQKELRRLNMKHEN